MNGNVQTPKAKTLIEECVSIVVPVYQGELTLEALLLEIVPLTQTCTTPKGRPWRISEVVLVFDGAKDNSAAVIRQLAKKYSFVHPLWLSRNYGQHAATIAGMSSTSSEWIATIDEDGQFAPGDIALLLDQAFAQHAQLIYGKSTNAPPHGKLRNAASHITKTFLTDLLTGGNVPEFSSFRLMLGEIGRSVAAYMGPGVYLDICLSWTFGVIGNCPVRVRKTEGRTSGYTYRKLISHFVQLVITVGTRPLRLVSFAGIITAFAGVVFAIVLLIERFFGYNNVQGWTSLAVILLLLGGAILFSLGVVSEYLGAAVRMAMGKPLYLITSDPMLSPLNRTDDGTFAEPSIE